MNNPLTAPLPPAGGTDIMRVGPRVIAVSTFTVIPLSAEQLSMLDAELAKASGESAGETEDLGRGAARARRFKRAGQKGKKERQARIAARVSVRVAKAKGLKVDRRQVVKTAVSAAKSGKKVYNAVVAGLKAGGLSQKQAMSIATAAIASLRSGGDPAKAKALIAKRKQRRQTRRAGRQQAQQQDQRRATLSAGSSSAAPLPSAQDEGADAAEFEPSEDSEIDESGDELPEDENSEGDLSGFDMDKVKPYLPYALLAVGAGIVFYSLRKKDK